MRMGTLRAWGSYIEKDMRFEVCGSRTNLWRWLGRVEHKITVSREVVICCVGARLVWSRGELFLKRFNVDTIAFHRSVYIHDGNGDNGGHQHYNGRKG